MNQKFINETGVILGHNHNPILVVEGTPASVEFPGEDIIKINQTKPGSVYALAHSHPDQMYGLSQRDKSTLKTLAFTLYPYPIRMITLALVSEDIFRIMTYFAHLESKESWVLRGKQGERNFEILTERSEVYCLGLNYSFKNADWKTLLIRKSYEEQNDGD